MTAEPYEVLSRDPTSATALFSAGSSCSTPRHQRQRGGSCSPSRRAGGPQFIRRDEQTAAKALQRRQVTFRCQVGNPGRPALEGHAQARPTASGAVLLQHPGQFLFQPRPGCQLSGGDPQGVLRPGDLDQRQPGWRPGVQGAGQGGPVPSVRSLSWWLPSLHAVVPFTGRGRVYAGTVQAAAAAAA